MHNLLPAFFEQMWETDCIQQVSYSRFSTWECTTSQYHSQLPILSSYSQTDTHLIKSCIQNDAFG